MYWPKMEPPTRVEKAAVWLFIACGTVGIISIAGSVGGAIGYVVYRGLCAILGAP